MSKKTREAKRKAMSTKERRSAQKDSGLSMKEYKSGKKAAPTVAPSPSPSPSSSSSSSSTNSSSSKQQQAKNRVQQRLGDEQYKNVSQAGLQDATEQGSYSANEVIAEFRNREKGVSVDEGDNSVLARFQKAQAGGAKFNNKAQEYLSKYGMTFDKKGKGKGKEEVETPVVETPVTETPVTETPPVVDTVDNSINVNTGSDSGTSTGNSFDRTFGDNENVIGDNNTISGNVNQGNQDFSTNIGGSSSSGSASNQEGAQDFLNDKMTQTFDRDFGDNQNTVGDNNQIYGNLNQGNQDFSVNIGGGTGNSSDGGMSNLQYGAASKAMMENQYQRNKQTFSAGGAAAATAARAAQVTGSNERINKLDQATDQNIDYFRRASDRSTLGLYGDIWNMKAPTWKAPGDLDKIETTYDKDKDDE